jgi:ribonuclease Z
VIPPTEQSNKQNIMDTQNTTNTSQSVNPYGGGPGTGISLPPYFKPTPYLKNNNVYFPGTEELGKDEMRISFVGIPDMIKKRIEAKVSAGVEDAKEAVEDLGKKLKNKLKGN